MGFIEDMKRWQWIALSLIVGAIMGYLNINSGSFPAGAHGSMSTLDFQHRLLSSEFATDPSDVKQTFPRIIDISVHPPLMTQVGDKMVRTQLVTFKSLSAPDANGRLWYQPFAMFVKLPFEPEPSRDASIDGNESAYPATALYQGQPGDSIDALATRFYGRSTLEGRQAIILANRPLRLAERAADLIIDPGSYYYIPWDPAANHTVDDFLNEAAAWTVKQPKWRGAPITFRFNSWEMARYGYPIWMCGSFIVVGLIWPTVIQMMLKSGFGRNKPIELEIHLDDRKTEESVSAISKVVANPYDAKKMLDLVLSLTTSLAEEPTDTPSFPPAIVAEPIKKLLGGNATSQVHAPPQDEEGKSFEGEYYPVARPNRHA